ncbi:TetR/AcrR family transcriptional regulator [Paenarthrobacter aurescens]|uniref:TetR/AcrR family transcriptional regulator n=1 Tax=Paenarthrobacter aurescens TaxID=43663 RepID=UPI0035E8083C
MDVAKRERLVSEAAWRVLVRDGLASLSVRHVAAEAGLPPSSLRYTFPTQSDLRIRAFERVIDRFRERVAGVAGYGSPAWARETLMQLLPLDEERRLEMEVFLVLGNAAITDTAMRPLDLAAHRANHELCTRALTVLQGSEAVDELEVNRLHALIDGLALHLVRQPSETGAFWAVETLDAHMAQVAAV